MRATSAAQPRRFPRLLLALVLGGAAATIVYLYVASLENRQMGVVPRSKVLVAKTDLAAGSVPRADQFELRELPSEAIGPSAVASLSQIRGKELAVPIAAGEQLLASRLREPSEAGEKRLSARVPPGKRAVAVKFSEETASGGLIRPGDRVDVIATFDTDTLGKHESMLVLQDVLVLAVGQSTAHESGAENGAGSTALSNPVAKPAGLLGSTEASTAPRTAGTAAKAPKIHTLTLAVMPEAAQRLALAEDLGKLRYLLRPMGDHQQGEVPPTDLAALQSAVKPPAAHIVDVEVSPAAVKVGDPLTVKITVLNRSNKPLATQGPHPGFTYLQGQSFRSEGFLPEAGKWRVALGSSGPQSTELPYRWGLGDDLAPGTTTTVMGQIKVTHEFKETNFWAALIEESVDVAQNDVGNTMVTALPQSATVVAQEGVNALSGPTADSAILLRLEHGTVLSVIGQRAGWFIVRLPDKREAWLAADGIAMSGS